LAAEATERVRLATFVLNTSFYNPTVLAREIASTDQYTGGRLDIGLGAGYIKDEFDAAGIPWEGAGRRIDHLERTVVELATRYADANYQPQPAQKAGPPLMIGGRGDRLLTLAARHADVIAFSGTKQVPDGAALKIATAEEVAERVAFARNLLGERAGEVEFNILIQQVLSESRAREQADVWGNQLELTPEQLAEVPTMLIGTPEECAAKLHERRARFGFSYVFVLEPWMEAFAEVMALLR
jgi:probable F420-dependent oxidoreductase